MLNTCKSKFQSKALCCDRGRLVRRTNDYLLLQNQGELKLQDEYVLDSRIHSRSDLP
ncbi:hypothetical protein Peur_013668 [Populus x canadensis]